MGAVVRGSAEQSNLMFHIAAAAAASLLASCAVKKAFNGFRNCDATACPPGWVSDGATTAGGVVNSGTDRSASDRSGTMTSSVSP